ncbi:MAG: hypothetical protein C5B59_14505 [Bacteroidetes bacterium]|nr:MAG: hypothetical protein C5B59_14505 [Bacteroidota bacterium]
MLTRLHIISVFEGEKCQLNSKTNQAGFNTIFQIPGDVHPYWRPNFQTFIGIFLIRLMRPFPGKWQRNIQT